MVVWLRGRKVWRRVASKDEYGLHPVLYKGEQEIIQRDGTIVIVPNPVHKG